MTYFQTADTCLSGIIHTNSVSEKTQIFHKTQKWREQRNDDKNHQPVTTGSEKITVYY